MRPGQREGRSSCYRRHGTHCLIANFEVVTGRIIAPCIGESRTEADFVVHMAQTLQSAPPGEWLFSVDPLKLHPSEG